DASSGQLVSIESDGTRDTATVHFRSTWRRVTGDDKKGDQRSQNWCFQRSSTALTEIGAASDRCPNCGATLQSSAGTCRYCGTRIGDEGGWQVIRIDDVAQQEPASAAAMVREIMAAYTAARAAAPQAQTAPPAARTNPVGVWISRAFALAVVLAAIGAYGAFGTGPVHRIVAKVVP